MATVHFNVTLTKEHFNENTMPNRIPKRPCLTVYLKQMSQRVAPPTEAFTVLNKPCGVEYLRVYSHRDCDFLKQITHSYKFREHCGYFRELGSTHSVRKGK